MPRPTSHYSPTPHEVCVPYLLSAHQSLGLRYGRLDTGADGFTLQQQGLYGGTANLYFGPPSRSTSDRWTHLYALYDRADGVIDNFALYVDGIKQTPVGSKGFNYPARQPGLNIEIGGIQPGRQVGPDMGNVKKGNNGDYYSATFPGVIDDVRIYDRPLTEAEIRILASRTNLSENLPPIFDTDDPVAATETMPRRAVPISMPAVFDDGLPEGGSLTCKWNVLSGDPSNVSFEDAMARETTFTAMKSGTYVLQLQVSDGERTAYSRPLTVNAETGCVILLR